MADLGKSCSAEGGLVPKHKGWGLFSLVRKQGSEHDFRHNLEIASDLEVCRLDELCFVRRKGGR